MVYMVSCRMQMPPFTPLPPLLTSLHTTHRRYGHNELDQPMYTQPQLYSKIVQHPDTLTVYEAQLVADGTAQQEDLDAVKVWPLNPKPLPLTLNPVLYCNLPIKPSRPWLRTRCRRTSSWPRRTTAPRTTGSPPSGRDSSPPGILYYVYVILCLCMLYVLYILYMLCMLCYAMLCFVYTYLLQVGLPVAQVCIKPSYAVNVFYTLTPILSIYIKPSLLCKYVLNPPMVLNRQHARIRETGYNAAFLKDIGVKMSTAPAKFNMHKQLLRILAARIDTIEKGEGIDWGTAEVHYCTYVLNPHSYTLHVLNPLSCTCIKPRPWRSARCCWRATMCG
jgi:hypothetical protein